MSENVIMWYWPSVVECHTQGYHCCSCPVSLPKWDVLFDFNGKSHPLTSLC